MSRAIPGRLVALESRHQLHYFQRAILESFQETAEERGLPDCTRSAILGTLQDWYAQYSTPPVGWESNLDPMFKG